MNFETALIDFFRRLPSWLRLIQNSAYSAAEGLNTT